MRTVPAGTAPILQASEMSVDRGGQRILDVPDLSVRPGEILALIGPNGAGKSTLLLALSSIAPTDRGTLRFHGKTVGNGVAALDYRRRTGMVFQEPLLFDATVASNVAAGLRFRGVDGRERERRVAENLERFRISHLAHRSSRTLSGGEAQRTSLARALAIEPEILLLDEPFAALDPPTRDALTDDLEVTLRQTGTTTVFATHDRDEALRLSDRVAVMNTGRIVQAGPPDEVMNRPVDEFVASFVGVETILMGTVTKVSEGTVTVRVGQQDVSAAGAAALGSEAALCVRPEHVSLHADSAAARGSARNLFTGKVLRLSRAGFYVKVVVDCGFSLTALITSDSAREMGLDVGKPVAASIKATAIHVIRRG